MLSFASPNEGSPDFISDIDRSVLAIYSCNENSFFFLAISALIALVTCVRAGVFDVNTSRNIFLSSFSKLNSAVCLNLLND
jgi:hypothetical protein